MNWQHLTLILWLRWRLSYNQWRRAGAVNAVLTMAMIVAALIAAVVAFFVALIVGCLMLSRVEPDYMMLMWDGIIAAFLFFWSIGVVADLQRSEFLSLDKMLHFPISPTGAFLLNYLSSLASLVIILFLPAMIGLSIASVVTHGPAMLLLFPLVLGFILVVTALTYQFRGWMATLMQDKRRRRTIIMLLTAFFIVMTQIPIFAQFVFNGKILDDGKELRAARTELLRQLKAGEIDHGEFGSRYEELQVATKAEKKAAFDRNMALFMNTLATVNLVVPVGWLPYAARAAATGNPWPGVLGSSGLALLGTVSLWRSYRGTLRMYTGYVRPSKLRQVAAKDRLPIESAPFMERRILGCSEQVAVVVLGSLRHMMRAPEAKMALLSPLILAVIFGAMLFLGPIGEFPPETYPFLSIAAISMAMFGSMQLMVNLFGNDRGGFRAFVLMPVLRRDILIGKNLAIAPLVVVMASIVVVAVQIVAPLKLMHFAATLIQLVPAFLLVCLVGNMTSIFAPMPVATGSMKPVQPKLWPILMHMFAWLTMPVVLVPAVAALAVELLLDKFAGGRWFPLYLMVSLVELPIALFAYWRLIAWQGALLQGREAKILEVVTENLE